MPHKHVPIAVDASIHAAIRRFAAFEGVSMGRFIGAVLWSGYMNGPGSKVSVGELDHWFDNALAQVASSKLRSEPLEGSDEEYIAEDMTLRVENMDVTPGEPVTFGQICVRIGIAKDEPSAKKLDFRTTGAISRALKGDGWKRERRREKGKGSARYARKYTVWVWNESDEDFDEEEAKAA